MPIITLEGPKLDRTKKAEIVKGFTDTACRVIDTIPRQAFVVIVKENPDENVGVGGELLPDIKTKK